jgi:hypothetical protein
MVISPANGLVVESSVRILSLREHVRFAKPGGVAGASTHARAAGGDVRILTHSGAGEAERLDTRVLGFLKGVRAT